MRLLVLHVALGGHLEALLGAGMRFHLGHLRFLYSTWSEASLARWGAAPWAGARRRAEAAARARAQARMQAQARATETATRTALAQPDVAPAPGCGRRAAR